MNSFINACLKISPLSIEAQTDLDLKIKTKFLKKNEIIFKIGSVCNSLLFIKSGLLQHELYLEDKKFILKFFSENEFCAVIESFALRFPNEYQTIAKEDTEFEYISYEDFMNLCSKHHCVETLYRKILTNTIITLITRRKGISIQSAREKYELFLKEFGHLNNRLSLGDIACFLGITQVSLSRLRKKRSK